MYIARILYPVKVLGPGNRVGIWFDGCNHQCPGCSNPELWNTTERYETTISVVERLLDKVAEGNEVWYELLDKFYKEFEPLVESAYSNMEKEAPEETGEFCPECGKPLVFRYGKFGKFVACSGYPECKYIPKVTKEVKEICDCPLCEGKIIEKKTKKGKSFYRWNNYPKYNYALWDKPTGEKCKICGELLVEKKGNVYCPKCGK